MRTRFITLLTLFFALVSASAQAQFWKKDERTLLPEEEAFSVIAEVASDGVLKVDWSIADGYYMYREQFAIESLSPDVTITEVVYPNGVIENDPEFGDVEVYFFNAGLRASVSGSGPAELLLKGQGCNKPVGVCYPPMARKVSIVVPDEASESAAANTPSIAADTGSTPSEKGMMAYIVSAFFAGILLSFTPCVLPMIPIVAGIIAGQGSPSRLRSGLLALSYVAGTIVTYIAAGAIAGATGAQLQAWFQNIWVIGAICLLLLLLALSLFGAFRLELPSSVQTRLNGTGGSARSAMISSFSLGLVSALVVGACVSPVLILALGTAISQGDPVLGAAIMGSMALGMGLLLIAFGFGAGWLLPRAGAWMQHVQILFGFMVLGVAVYLLAAFPELPILLLWSALFLGSGFYLWHMASQSSQPLIQTVLRTLSASALIWGGLTMVGGATGGDDVLRPLTSLSVTGGSATEKPSLPFNKTVSLEQVQDHLNDARRTASPVMLDFYADWCLDCKRMHKTTFRSERVHAALEGWRLIEVDVTETSAVSEKVKRHFEVFGPPATLLFNADGSEAVELRQYGYLDETEFLTLISKVKQ